MHLPGFGPEQSLEWPPIELIETEREWKLIADLPGLDPADVEVLVTSRQVTLRGESRRKISAGSEPTAQRFYGHFERIIGLPKPVRQENVAASFSEGRLTVVMTKLARTIKRIEVE